jgi:hypothetical protein
MLPACAASNLERRKRRRRGKLSRGEEICCSQVLLDQGTGWRSN